MKTYMLSIVCVLFHVLVFSREKIQQNRPGLSLEETFEIYVKSIQNADLQSLFTTITSYDSFRFLTAQGILIDSRQGYYQFHEDWFRQTGWEMTVDVVNSYEEKGIGYMMAIFHYKQETADKHIRVLDSYFTLIFHREDKMWKVIADICTPIKRYMTEMDQNIRYTPEQQYLFKTIDNRRTVRQFKNDPVPNEHLMKILDAARFAPTAGNQQPWKFLVVRDKVILERLKDLTFSWYRDRYPVQEKSDIGTRQPVNERLREMLNRVLSAPVYVAVLADIETRYPEYVIHDGTLAAGYLMIAARGLGYGTGFYTTFFPEDKMKQVFNIPDRFRLICFTPIGIPEVWPEPPPKKDLNDIVVFDSF